MKQLLFILFLLANQAFAQEEKTQDLKTDIKNVTVFLKGAQVTRQGDLNLRAGRSIVVLKSLSPHIDAKSIQVKGKGAFTILSVNHSYNYFDGLEYDDRIDSLIAQIKQIESKIAINHSRISVLNEKLSLLNENKKLGNETTHATITELKLAVEFYDKTLMDIKTEDLKLRDKNQEYNKQLEKIRNQIKDIQNNTGEPTSEISVSIEVDRPTLANFTVDYLVANAGWYPKYDLRVKDVQSPLQLTYKAELYQNTGIDWNNVKLKFSNGDPNQSGVAPKLTTWYLNYQRNTIYNRSIHGLSAGNVSSVSGRVTDENNEPIPGVNVIIKGSTIGTVTDLQGNYQLTLPNNATYLSFSSVGYVNEDLPITSSNINHRLTPDVTSLNEVVVMGYSSSASASPRSYQKPYVKKEKALNIITTTIENQTTVEFEVDKPYSLKSNGKNLTVNLNTYDIETLYEYYAVPKLDKDAFLIARIINWDQFNLLEGEANLYFEDAYVGRSVLDAKTLTDTLDISLGRDKNIVIGREKVDTFTKRTSLGANKVETRGFEIMVRNKKSQPIHLTIFDQIPVSAISPIEITPKELSAGILDSNTGEITWVLDLPSNNQVTLEMEYEVKYPKKEKVILE